MINVDFEKDRKDNYIYMSFLTNENISGNARLSIFDNFNICNANVTDFVKAIYGDGSIKLGNKMIVTENLIDNYGNHDKYYQSFDKTFNGIRPVIYTSMMELFLEKYFQKIDDITYIGGSYPTKVVDYSFGKKIKENGTYTKEYYNILIDDEIFSYEIIEFNNEKYAYSDIANVFIKITPLKWHYDKYKNVLVCDDIIAGMNTNLNNSYVIDFAYNFMNNYLFKDIFKDNIKFLTEKVTLDNFKIDDKVYKVKLPYEKNIELSSDGTMYFHNENEFDIDISENVSKVGSNIATDLNLPMRCDYSIFNINLSGDKTLNASCFNFPNFKKGCHIKSLNVDGKITSDSNRLFILSRPIENVNMLCDFNLFTSLFLGNDKEFIKHSNYGVCKNLLLLSNLTIKYNNEKELLSFLKDVKRFIELFYKSFNKCKRNDYGYIDFIYKYYFYKYEYKKNINSYKCDNLSKKEFDNLSIRNLIGANNLTFVGPKIDLNKVSNFFNNDDYIKFEFIEKADLKESDLINKEGKNEITKDNPLTKEASHILDLAREIISIDYIGLDKNNIKEKVNDIINEYNLGLKKYTSGLSLTTNESVYTNAILKLETLRDNLYLNFEKNMNYFDIFDLINILNKKLNKMDITDDFNLYEKRINNDDLFLSKNILIDLEIVIKISNFLGNDIYLNDILSYLDSEKQNIVNYLNGNNDINYKNINEFIICLRTYLVPVLTTLNADVTKKDVITSIKDYTLNEMNNNTLANQNSYINLILSEIDKVKKDILSFNSGYVFEKLDYENLSSGKEIIDYLDKMYIKYYRVYLDLLNEKNLNENYEKSKVPNL